MDRSESYGTADATLRRPQAPSGAGQFSRWSHAETTDVGAAALREAHEEVGIEPGHVSVIGYLSPMPSISGYAITPVVGLVSDRARLRIDRTEVDRVFEVPLNFLLDHANERLVERHVFGRPQPMAEFHYGGERIWGKVTAQILLLLRKNLY